MARWARGESTVTIDGEEYTLCMTVGALADIQDHYDIDDMTELSRRMASPRVGDLLVMLWALLNGGGADITLAEVKRLEVTQETLNEVAAAVQKALGGDDEAANPPKAPRKSRGAAGRK